MNAESLQNEATLAMWMENAISMFLNDFTSSHDTMKEILIWILLFFLLDFTRQLLNKINSQILDNYLVSLLKLGKVGAWPKLKLFYFKAPPMFNDDLLKIMNLTNQTTSIHHHFLIEIYLRDILANVPILTNNITEADLVYVDYLATLDFFTMRQRNKSRCIFPELRKILKDNNIPDEKLLFFTAFPITLWACVRPANKSSFIGSIERRSDRPRDFVIPYHTHFDYYPIEKYRQENVIKNISVIMAGSLIVKRRMYADMMKKIPNSKVVAISRTSENIRDLILSIPRLYAKSTFCIIPAGDTPSSKRLYDGMSYDCIPIILSDNIVFPYDGTLMNWNEFSIKVPEANYNDIPRMLKKLPKERIMEYHKNLRINFEKLRFDNGVTNNNGVNSMFWDLYIRYFRNRNNN